jgi:DnaJ-class molecular chaperone
MQRATSSCPKCRGTDGVSSGRIPHQKRQLTYDGQLVDDPTDFQTEETCDRCGGSGRVAYDPATISESASKPS